MKNLKIDYESIFIQGQYGTYGTMGELLEDEIVKIHLSVDDLSNGIHFTVYLDDDYNVVGFEDFPDDGSKQDVIDFISSQGSELYEFLDEKLTELKD